MSFIPWFPIGIPEPAMAHCGICNSSYPAHYYHRCCGQGECPGCVALKTRVAELEALIAASASPPTTGEPKHATGCEHNGALGGRNERGTLVLVCQRCGAEGRGVTVWTMPASGTGGKP